MATITHDVTVAIGGRAAHAPASMLMQSSKDGEVWGSYVSTDRFVRLYFAGKYDECLRVQRLENIRRSRQIAQRRAILPTLAMLLPLVAWVAWRILE